MELNEILVLHGTNPKAMAFALAQAAGLAAHIGEKNRRIGLKPNLVVAKKAALGATTHPEILAGLIEYLQGEGFVDLCIIEGSWVGDDTARAFKVCGYEALAKQYGVPLIDTQQDPSREVDCAGMPLRICEAALALDFIINLPVHKGHCQTRLTCALKNLKGLIPNSEKRRFHQMGLHAPIAHLSAALKSGFILVDGICGDPGFEEGGNPLVQNRLFAARDAVLCDTYAARLLEIDPAEVPYIGMAEALGVGSAGLAAARVRTLGEGGAGADGGALGGPRPGGLAANIEEDGACSACYAALVAALGTLSEDGRRTLPGRVSIGQGFKGRAGALGVGACCAGFAQNVPGCPPTAEAMAALLRAATR